MARILITGSSGLIGSEAAFFYGGDPSNSILGIDNNMRESFFGPDGDTTPVRESLERSLRNYEHESIDIRNREAIFERIKRFRPDCIIHAAGQPSHDWAAGEPFTDFEVNALGTLHLLEAMRLHARDAGFVFLSSNKVYGDSPNRLSLEETSTRYEYRGPMKGNGIDEAFPVDQSLHSPFGVSKLSADILCQEYGRYYGLNVGVFRAGCVTGSRQAGVELHGFLSYLVHCAVTGKIYNIIGYKGKQVRDQIHSSDVISALEYFRQNPRPGEVYNLGGGYEHSASIVELIEMLNSRFGLVLKTQYVDEARKGDHICYYADMSKFKRHYPDFLIRMSLKSIIAELVEAEGEKAPPFLSRPRAFKAPIPRGNLLSDEKNRHRYPRLLRGKKHSGHAGGFKSGAEAPVPDPRLL